ncbi:MAG: class I SAM-dependent methyltransferase [Hyphomicrobiaceae bacterium]|nr:class I SAM-dependent methyltransferase [Hyphomicrobiaceae bacterium]
MTSNEAHDFAPARPSRLRRIGYSFACLGWRGGLAELANKADVPEADPEFDARHGTDTAGAVEPGDLGIDDAETTRRAIRYLPSPLRVTNWMLDRIGVAPEGCAFVDLGCGKGRVLLNAAQRPFAKVVGVEISSDLAAIARRNVETFQPASARVRAISIANADARAFEMPAGDLLIHMYHPFDPSISAAVFARLAAAPRAQPRRVAVAYLTYTQAVPEVAGMFAGLPWLRLTRYEETIRGRYNWLLYKGTL